MENLVECHSGFEYGERPTALFWEEQRLEIAKIVNQWRGPKGKHFQVETTEGQLFKLFFDQQSNEWTITQH